MHGRITSGLLDFDAYNYMYHPKRHKYTHVFSINFWVNGILSVLPINACAKIKTLTKTAHPFPVHIKNHALPHLKKGC